MGHKHREHPGVAIEPVVCDFAASKEADQRHIAQGFAHDLQFGTGLAKVGANSRGPLVQ